MAALSNAITSTIKNTLACQNAQYHIQRTAITTLKQNARKYSDPFDNFDWRNLQLSPKNSIPEPACYTKTVLIVGKVVLEVVFLKLLPVVRETVHIVRLNQLGMYCSTDLR
jgi:hypothetical protein